MNALPPMPRLKRDKPAFEPSKERGQFTINKVGNVVKWNDPQGNADIYGSGVRKVREAKAKLSGLGPNPNLEP